MLELLSRTASMEDVQKVAVEGRQMRDARDRVRIVSLFFGLLQYSMRGLCLGLPGHVCLWQLLEHMQHL